MRDLLFEAGANYFPALAAFLGSPRTYKDCIPLSEPQTSATGQPAHSHMASIDVYGLLLRIETREGGGILLFQRTQRLRLADGLTRRTTNRASTPELWLCNLEREFFFFHRILEACYDKGGSKRIDDTGSF